MNEELFFGRITSLSMSDLAMSDLADFIIFNIGHDDIDLLISELEQRKNTEDQRRVIRDLQYSLNEVITDHNKSDYRNIEAIVVCEKIQSLIRKARSLAGYQDDDELNNFVNEAESHIGRILLESIS